MRFHQELKGRGLSHEMIMDRSTAINVRPRRIRNTIEAFRSGMSVIETFEYALGAREITTRGKRAFTPFSEEIVPPVELKI